MDKSIELILQVRSGNDNAFSQLCDQYKNLIESMSRKYSAIGTEQYSSQEDFVQEAKMAFYSAIMRYDTDNDKVTFGAFAKVCIRNKLISCVRKQNSQKRRKGENSANDQGDWSLQDAVVRRELGEKLISVAEDVLSKYERKIFSLYLGGRKAKEISQIVNKDEKSVNNAIYRIRLKLKKTVTQ